MHLRLKSLLPKPEPALSLSKVLGAEDGVESIVGNITKLI